MATPMVGYKGCYLNQTCVVLSFLLVNTKPKQWQKNAKTTSGSLKILQFAVIADGVPFGGRKVSAQCIFNPQKEGYV